MILQEKNSGMSYDMINLKFLNNKNSTLHRVLKSTGAICWQVGSCVKNSELIPLDIIYYPIFKDMGFVLRNRIVWNFNVGKHSLKRLSGRYETILYFTKSSKYIFNLDDIRLNPIMSM